MGPLRKPIYRFRKQTVTFPSSLFPFYTIKAALLAAGFSGRVCKRSLNRLAATDTDAKDKEIIFLRDKVYQLKMQVTFPRTFVHCHLPVYPLFKEHSLEIQQFCGGPMSA